VLRNDADLDTKEGKALESKHLDLIHAHVAMINYSLKHSYYFNRWKNVVNVMIEKEPGNSRVHHLRVIHIYEADYNFLLQAKWRALIQKAEIDKTIHDGQYGSRPGRDALIPAFIEEMKNEICHATRKSLINLTTTQRRVTIGSYQPWRASSAANSASTVTRSLFMHPRLRKQSIN
jgi:hypothetical protein